MYQVLTMYGENEPWWFFEDWQADIRVCQEFQTFAQAQQAYLKQWQTLRDTYNHVHVKPNFLTAFWNDGEEHWCEDCEEGLQLFMGLALLKDYEAVSMQVDRDFYETINEKEKEKTCQRKQA
ncbi:DUF1033 family protein [Enterococcus lemanii]|jgi:hypothetical protein|uniref:DUF1033 family protein n=1 Tax=Enterococcus lemanii TaxID=1159752 RepID=A0ABV9MZT6_9ENTE|nr:DUF1033 family protein [Enterococcus lemanii]MBM7709656.1 hypothetical protein [Enterococcus lemanii]NLM66373.1 DUF1033 family protein [Enterococcus sp.]